VVFVELPAFTRRLFDLFDDESFLSLQIQLAARPAPEISFGVAGDSANKIRWAAKGHGKRGGARVIYFWRTAESQIILARLYAKNEQEDLSSAELKTVIREIGL
jgi:mRNA-degrading endonuclease RelE of RelBE toxin-antitoxin system